MNILKNSFSKSRNGTLQKAPTNTSDDINHHQAFDNSLVPNILMLVKSGEIIIANSAACKLLGYTKEELLTQSRSTIFEINESGFKKMLIQRNEEGKSVAQVTAIAKCGILIPCEISSAVFTGEDGIEKAINVITDMRQRMLKQKNIDTEKEKIVADNIVLAIFKQKKIDVEKQKIVDCNIVKAKSKQKEIDLKKEKIVADNIDLAIQKQKGTDIKNEKIVADNIEQAKSKQKKIDVKKEKIVADNILLKDKLLTEFEAGYKHAFNSSSDVLYDINLITKKVIVSDGYEKEFGYTITGNIISVADWMSHIHPEDKELVLVDRQRMLASEDIEWRYGYRFLKADNSVANVVSNAIVLRNAGGKAYRMVGSMHDISKQIVLEERLEQEIKLKEKQIADAMGDARDTERSDIGKELHDNINQLLVASGLYLKLARRGGVNSEMYLNRSSEYTLTAIEEIRKLTKGLTTEIIKNLGLCEAIENIVHDTMEINPLIISCNLKGFIEYSVNEKFKLNIYRIVQEQLNNILKHARATEVDISLSQNQDNILLDITDNGVGFDTEVKRMGIGIENIKSRALTYFGTADFVSQPGRGCKLKVSFPITVALMNKG